MKEKMETKKIQPKVCHLTSAHPYNDDRIFIKQCRSLTAAGYETHIVAPGAPNDIENGILLHNIPNLYHNNRLSRMTLTVWSVYQKALAVNADIYHLHDPELISIGLLLKARGKRVIYDIHEDLPRQILLKPYLPRSSRRPIGWLMEHLEHVAGHRFSALVAATPAIGARFQTVNPRTVVINNYPLRDELNASSSIAWEERAHAIAYVGSISELRGLLQMVEAMEYVSERLQATLEMAGSFSPPQVRERVGRLRGWAHTHELGMLNRTELACLLGKVRAGLVTLHPTSTYISSQPIKLFEYMSAGIPVIASDFPLWSDFIKQTGCGLVVNPLDPRAIARAIEFVLTNPSAAETMGRHGREAVERHYNWESEAPKLVQLYKSLLGSANL